MSEGLRVEWVPARLCRERYRDLIPGRGRAALSLLQPGGRLRSPRWKGWRVGTRGIGRQRSLQPCGNCRGPEASRFLFSSLFVMALQDSVAASSPPLPVGPSFPRLPRTRVFFSHPSGWKSSQSSVWPLYLRVRGVHTTLQPISTARKTYIWISPRP